MTTTMIADTDRNIMVKTVVTEEPLTVDYDDIEGRGEQDDWHCDAPWEDCDGWDHEFYKDGYYTHEGRRDSRGWVNRTTRNGGSGYIEIDDDDIVDKWGFTRRNGEAKQVWLERVARVKRDALDQLVKWYSDGWYISCAIAEYGDYMNCVGGIWDEPWGDHTEELIEECRMEVAAEMERDGYEVSGVPERKPYNPLDHHKDRIRRNLDMS